MSNNSIKILACLLIGAFVWNIYVLLVANEFFFATHLNSLYHDALRPFNLMPSPKTFYYLRFEAFASTD
jgi:hypothetical protein